MKVIMYMAITPNGIIATKHDDTGFVSSNEWKHFNAMAKHAGNLIVGHRTYEIMIQQKETSELEKIPIIVVGTSVAGKLPTHFFVNSLKSAIALAKSIGCKTALFAGGGQLNGSAMKEGLVDEIFLDIEPTFLGTGICLFSGSEFKSKLKLIGVKKLSRDEVQLHYKVIR